jgi:tetratricopeptide (TPR) repeat protein
VAEQYRAALKADGKLAVAHYNLGVLAEHSGALDEAEQYYRKAVSLDPTLDIAVDNLGALVERGSGGPAAARKLYSAIVERNPRAVSARTRLGGLAVAAGDAGEAVALAREALAHEPRSLDSYRLLARAYLAQKQVSLAKLMALRGFKISPNDAEMTAIMGQILMAEKDHAAALATFRKAVASDASQMTARHCLAAAALEARDYAGAAEQYEEIVRRASTSLAALLNLGLAYQGLGKFTQARDAWLVAQRAYPDAAEINFALADLYMRNLTQYAEAKKELKLFLQKRGSGLSNRHPAVQMMAQVDDLIRAEEESKRQMEDLKRKEAEQAEEEKAKQAAEAPPPADAPPPSPQPPPNG